MVVKNKKGQAGLEYLVILAAVIAISVIVTMFVNGSFGQNRDDALLNACRSQAAQCAISKTTNPSDPCNYCLSQCVNSAGKDLITGLLPVSPYGVSAVGCCMKGDSKNIFQGSIACGGTPPAGPVCGSGVCEFGETCSSCPADCACPLSLTVDAGTDKTTNVAVLQDATVSGGTGAITYSWTRVSGLGTVIFGSTSAVDTTITANDGTYVLRLTATDSAVPPVTAFDDMALIWDATAPTTTDNAPVTTSNSAVTVTLDCDDGSGVGCGITKYCTDPTGTTCIPTLMGNSVIVDCLTGEITCSWYVRYFSNDTLGNTELVHNTTRIYIDKTVLVPPTITVNSPAAGSWQRTQRFDVSITDTGAVKCSYRVLSNGVVTQDWVIRTCSSPLSIWCSDEGTNVCRLDLRANNSAGEVSASTAFSIDITNPVLTLNPSVVSSVFWSNIPVIISCSDVVSGCGSSSVSYGIVTSVTSCSGYTTTGASPQTATMTCALGSTCKYKLCYSITDIAGNVISGEKETYSVDYRWVNNPYLRGYWSFDGTTSGVINEYNGIYLPGFNKAEGFVYNVSDVVSGQSIQSDNFLIKYNTVVPQLQLRNDLTVSAWIKIPMPSGFFHLSQFNEGGRIVTTNQDAGRAPYEMFLKDANNVGCGFYTSMHRSNGADVWSATNSIQPGIWYHVVCTYSSMQGGQLYINGKLNMSSGVSAGLLRDNFGNFYIGRGNENLWSNNKFNGKIDEVSIFNKVLSTDEINSLYTHKTLK